MAGDVGHQERDAAVVELLEVVIVAADGHLGQEDVREGKLLRERALHRIGQEHALDAAGGLEVAGEEMVFARHFGGMAALDFRGAAFPFAIQDAAVPENHEDPQPRD